MSYLPFATPLPRHLPIYSGTLRGITQVSHTDFPDKYTTFDKKAQAHGWRKGVHKVPKWTKVSRGRVTAGVDARNTGATSQPVIRSTMDKANSQLTLRENPLGF